MVIGGGNPLSPWAVCLATECFFPLCLDIVLTDNTYCTLDTKVSKRFVLYDDTCPDCPWVGGRGKEGQNIILILYLRN